MSRDWDAATYDRVSTPQVEWAEPVLARLPLRGDETVLDAGCGSGRVTRIAVDRVPRSHVVAVDSAASMVEHARAAVFQADLTELELDEPVDAAFSNAVFHWIPDHDALRAPLRRAPSRRDARGPVWRAGNVESLHRVANQLATEEPFAEHLTDWERPWHFAGAEETADRLERAGFTDIRAWLEPYPITPEDPVTFLRTVCLGPHLGRLPEELHDGYVEAVCERAGAELDHVRLNIDAKAALTET